MAVVAWTVVAACTAPAPPAVVADGGIPADAPGGAPAYALHELGAAGLLLDPAAKAAYAAILGPLRDEPWLAELDGPSPTNQLIDIAGRSFLLASACKNHDCYDNSVVLLYDALDGVMYGEVRRSGQVTLLGGPPPALVPELHRLWREEFRQGEP